MKPKGPILSFATSLPYSTAMRPHICESPCMSMQEKRCKARHRFHVESPRIRRALFCPVLPGAGMPRTCCCVNPRASSCLVMLSTCEKDNTFRMRLFHAVLALVVKIQFGISNRQKHKHKLIPMLRFWQAAFLSSYNSLVEAGKGFRTPTLQRKLMGSYG